MHVASVRSKGPACLQVHACMQVASVQQKGPFLQAHVSMHVTSV